MTFPDQLNNTHTDNVNWIQSIAFDIAITMYSDQGKLKINAKTELFHPS